MQTSLPLKKLNISSSFTTALFLLLAVIGLTLGAVMIYQTWFHPIKLHPGTHGWVKQVAVHVSKLSGGVGGFPGFEPPDDEPKYKERIKRRELRTRDVNDWVGDINKHLQSIINKNPNMTLEEILQKLGYSQAQIDDFIEKLRIIHSVAGQLHGTRYEPTYVRLGQLLAQLEIFGW